MIDDIRKEFRQEIEKLREEWDGRIKGLEDRMSEMEKYIDEQKEKERKREEEIRALEAAERWFETGIGGERSSRRQAETGSLRQSSIVMSEVSKESSIFSDKEVKRIRRLVEEKEKEEKKDNIVIKGVKVSERVRKEDIEKFINEKLGLQVKAKWCRLSGKVVVVVGMESEEMKSEIMRNKNKLKGGKIFIENDLTWWERKTQEKIGKWAREERKKGKEAKNRLREDKN